MKKSLFAILLLLISINTVNAYTYSSYSEEYPEGVNEILIEREVRYKWYKETITDIEYLPRSQFGNKEYDLNDFIYSNESEETMDKIESTEDRIVTQEYKSHTFSEDDINHVLISDMYYQSRVYFSEIEVYDTNTNKKIEYTFENEYNDIYHNDILNDGETNLYMEVYAPMRISLNLGKKYNMNNLLVKVYYKSEGTEYKRFTNMFAYGINLGLAFQYNIVGDCPNGCVFSLQKDSSYKGTLTHTIPFYKYNDKLYKTYNVNKEYENDYYKELDGYVKDEETKTIFYRYITDDHYYIDLDGNLVNIESGYCDKNYCSYIRIKKEEVSSPVIEDISSTIDIIQNPKTYDDIDRYLLSGIICTAVISLITIGTILLKKYVKKSHTNKISKFVEIHKLDQ